MKIVKRYIYQLLTVLFLFLSLFGGLYLSQTNQDNRNKAVGGGECACKDNTGKVVGGACKSDGSCICPSGSNPGTNKCNAGGGSGANCSGQCTLNSKNCQQNNLGKNTGYNCTCIDLSPDGLTCKHDWQCSTVDLKSCPTDSGEPDPNSGYCDAANKIKKVGRCFKSDPGTTISVVYKYKCPNQFTDLSKGCQLNEVIERNVTSVCFENNFCGAQQIDVNSGCFMSVVDKTGCTPTKTPPVNTPVNTVKPTKPPSTPIPTHIIPTNTTKPSITPSNTPIITSTLSPTNNPTNSPTNTPTNSPTNNPTNSPTTNPTNIPTNVIGPSPTRIILPSTGVEFPVQVISIIGVIITLLGFLILL